MSLVATFFGLAAIYASLSAHFLAVSRCWSTRRHHGVFIFVVMILNREGSRRWRCGRCACWASRRRLPAGRVRRGRRVGGEDGGAPAVVSDTTGTVASIGELPVPRVPVPVRGDLAVLLVAIVGGRRRSRARTRKRSPRIAPPTTASRSSSSPASDSPGDAGARPAAAGASLAMPSAHYLILVVRPVPDRHRPACCLRRNALIVLMGIELSSTAATSRCSRSRASSAIRRGTSSRSWSSRLAAAEAAVGLAILVGLFRSRQTINLDEATLMKR
jgi:NADH-quinone oxidoreductase subunit K